MNILDTCDLAVVGGGASGLMCAFTAASEGCSVVVLDGNRQAGRKLRITGKGRGNVTNRCTVEDFMKNIPGDGRFLYSALNRFSPEDTISFFEENGVPLKTERGNRVFPVSDNANDLADCLFRLCREAGVRFLRTRADSILLTDSAVSAVYTAEGTVNCRAAALCTGGLSYPLTGSDGAGYVIARSLGHRVTDLKPSLVPLESDDPWCAQLQGFSLKNVTLRTYEDEKLVYRELGEMLFTHFGVSGPLVLSASAHMRHFGSSRYRLEIDLKPGLDEDRLDARILRDFAASPNKQLVNILPGLVGRSMTPVVLQLSGVDGSLPAHDLTAEKRGSLRRLLKAFPVSVSGTRPVEEAIVTSGGVSTKEVNPRTMESKLVERMYFAGEILDLDAYTGGFNLQIAWSTGRVAGISVSKQLREGDL
ncbi:MAG: NAD(P)/FAD-dependent oxidoreductase [Oscillospiraceae bacterium]|nr:NAD(P)/FAD-dependent oxidoreductase [Oscillospiraceae bacterium]